MTKNKFKIVSTVFILLTFIASIQAIATEITDNTFLIGKINQQNFNNQEIWNFLQEDDATGIEIEIEAKNKNILLLNSGINFSLALEKISVVIHGNQSKIIPVFIKYDGNAILLDSVINESKISSSIFYLPQGETWPSLEYLVQANRRVIFFLEGSLTGESRILHPVKNYAFQVSASNSGNTFTNVNTENVNQELFTIENFEQLPTKNPPNNLSRNLVPDYINFLLENWKRYGKKPNFIFVGNNILNFDFIVGQLNSFTWIKGVVKISDKNFDKVYWKNPDILITGGKFSFPYRGGEELILTPFVPGFKMRPEQIVVTGEMIIPEIYTILATSLNLSEEMTGSFSFDELILNEVNKNQNFEGTNFSFIQDINRGNVLRLPENASINLGKPEIYGLRNSSFTVSCFVKFTEILEFGDNAILGNYESGYRRGLHLILRSGHPYFGLWANDYIADNTLLPNVWYHLTWRYIIETGEQAIFLNGLFIGGSEGHPPFSGTGDIHLGSALSSGASLRGYIDNLYIWKRPLGNEEINRLSLDEEFLLDEIAISEKKPFDNLYIWILSAFVFVALITATYIMLKQIRKKEFTSETEIPVTITKNQIQLFGEFKAIDKQGAEITELFTPKVKELFLFTLIYTLKSGIGASIRDINDNLWEGISSAKVANNRSVTLNKLRKILLQFDGIEIISTGGYLQAKFKKPFFCDYISAFKICQIPEGLSRQQLLSFFELVKRGRFLKGINWPWLDEIRGFTGNQVIDNLLNLATVYQKEMNLTEIEKIAQRILDYDDLNEEAIYLQVWALQKTNNSNLAKFNFNSFIKKYESNFGEPYPMTFSQFNQHFEKGFV